MKKNNITKVKILLSLILLFSFNSCKKKDALITITGTVFNSVNQNGISSIQIKLYSKELENNTFSNSFKLIQSATTDNNGSFKFEFDYRNALEYKIEISNATYFMYTKIINPDDLKVNEPNTLDITLDPKSVLKLRIKNQIPQTTADNIVLNSLNTNCELCYNPTLLSFNGTTVDTTVISNTLGQRYWKYAYYVTKNGFTIPTEDSVYCESGDTSFVNIFY